MAERIEHNVTKDDLAYMLAKTAGENIGALQSLRVVRRKHDFKVIVVGEADQPRDLRALAVRFHLLAERIDQYLAGERPHAGEDRNPTTAPKPSPESEVEKLREALRPFAKMAPYVENTNPHCPDAEDADFVSVELHPAYHRGVVVTVGDFRRARRALEDTDG